MASYRAIITVQFQDQPPAKRNCNLIQSSTKQERETKGQFAPEKHLFIGNVAKFIDVLVEVLLSSCLFGIDAGAVCPIRVHRLPRPRARAESWV